MSEPKRYFWLKLHKDFFQRKEIKRLRKIAGGDTYTIIYLKMLLRSIMSDGKLYFDGLEDDFASELALDLDEKEENVQITVAYLIKSGLLEMCSDDEYYLPDAKDNTGTETAVASRVRKHREKQKALQCNTNVTQVKHLCNGEKEKDKELYKDRELYKDIDIDTLSLCEQKTLIHNTWEDAFELITTNVKKSLDNLVDEYGAVLTKEAILDAKKQGKSHIKYIEGVLKNKLLESNVPVSAAKKKRFTKPTLEEIKQYCIERNNNVDAQHFYDYYESNGWKVGKNSMKNWQAAVRTWEKNSYTNTTKKTNTEQTVDAIYKVMNESEAEYGESGCNGSNSVITVNDTKF
ncbi:MAG: phage replisome organizer N-terminal domain-containing protein [Solobacterium sp.]|nr:phage replisome organizer N-terminal domain-containing protein [Solobacterium sp.]